MTEDGWEGLSDHTRRTLALVTDPVVKNSNCPHRYAILIQISVAAGLDKARMAAPFEEAISSERDYYHFYRYYAGYLQEKWYGAPGELVEFADRSAGCNCGSLKDLRQMSWPRIKDGYAAMERMYGTAMMKRNRMAFMAIQFGDLLTAKKMFEEIGEAW